MWLWIVGLIAILILALVALSMRLARGYERALALGEDQWREAVASLDESEVDAWAQGFIDTASEKMDLAFDLEDWRQGVELLDEVLTDPKRRHELLKAFHEPGLGYAGLIAAGAYLGELLVRHAGARWVFTEGQDTPRLAGLAHDDERGSLSRPFDTQLDLFWDRGPAGMSALIARAVAASGEPTPASADDQVPA